MIRSPGRRASARSVVWAPSSPGIEKSMKTTSASSVSSSARNSSPLPASPTTRYPLLPFEQAPQSVAEQRVVIDQNNAARHDSLRFLRRLPRRAGTAGSSCVLTRIAACMPLPFEEVIEQLPPSELILDEMFDRPMPQSIIACGLKPRPLSE